MLLNMAIAGYGNLGKSLEKEIAKDADINLAAIFSRRDIGHPLQRTFENAKDAKNIDVVLLALGSFDDITKNTEYFVGFDTVDSYDVHGKIEDYKALLNKTKSENISVCAAGWDPGILSVARGLGKLGGACVTTFWGKGISQGHSNALRAIVGVKDAVEITMPLESARAKTLLGQNIPANARHERLCYIACEEQDQNRIAQTVANMPDYFFGQQVRIEFCSEQRVREIKSNTYHAGEVIANGDGFGLRTKLDVESNTDYTAKVMLAYAKAIPQLKRDGYKGALDVFDIPLKYVAGKENI